MILKQNITGCSSCCCRCVSSNLICVTHTLQSVSRHSHD